MTVTLADIARTIGASIDAEFDGRIIQGLASVENAGPEHITFISNPRYSHFLPETTAGAVIVKSSDNVPAATVALIVDDPYFAFLTVLGLFNKRSTSDIAAGIHDKALIDPTAVIGNNVSIGPCAVIGGGVIIGDNTTIGACTVVMKDSVIGRDCLFYPNVSIMDSCIIGDRVIFHSGVVIGSDGFGFAPHDNSLVKIPQIGIVRIGDDVEIQANSCVDRAAFGETVVETGVKLDNFVQIAHNARVGAYTVMASQSGIAGSSTLGSASKVAAKVGISGHLSIGNGVIIGALSGVTKDFDDGQIISGFPARLHSDQLRKEAALKKLPDIIKTIRRMEKRISELENDLRNK